MSTFTPQPLPSRHVKTAIVAITIVMATRTTQLLSSWHVKAAIATITIVVAINAQTVASVIPHAQVAIATITIVAACRSSNRHSHCHHAMPTYTPQPPSTQHPEARSSAQYFHG
jgi:hypothetical protein